MINYLAKGKQAVLMSELNHVYEKKITTIILLKHNEHLTVFFFYGGQFLYELTLGVAVGDSIYKRSFCFLHCVVLTEYDL